jgi:rhamnulokinase
LLFQQDADQMKNPHSPYLAFDLGASSGRAVLGFLDGGKLRIQEIHRFANAPCQREGRWIWDLPFLWKNILKAMQSCAGQGETRLSGIGVDTWGVDFGLLNADGQLLADPMCYRDPVTDGVERHIGSAISQGELYRLTGMPFTRVSTFAQLVAISRSTTMSVPMSARTLLLMSDLCRCLLCGHKGIERTAAGTSQLINVRSTRWCASLFQTFHLPRRIMPELVSPATIVGRLRPDLVAETGLNRVPVIAVAGHDTASAAAAVPLDGDDVAFISCGTWMILGAAVARPITTPEARRHGFINQFGLDSILFVKHACGLYLFENLYQAMRRANQGIGYGELLSEASLARPFARFLDVDWPRFFAVEDVERRVAEFLRLTGQKTLRNRGAIVRTLLEGLAWSCRGTIHDLATLTGRTLRRISLVGGGARNPLLCQIIADATGLEVTAGPAEAAAAGNLAIQALATGRLQSTAEIRELIHRSFRLKTYSPRESEPWNRLASQHRDIVAKGRRLTSPD